MRLRMREGRTSGVPWGDGREKGDLGRRGKIIANGIAKALQA
jgi:hypothetical protein